MSISVHIERLILEGLPEGHAGIGTAIEAELARLLVRDGLAGAVSCHEASRSAAPIILVRPADLQSVGKQIGGSVYETLKSSSA
ncbi:MAG: hypothetical protein DME97_05395 [Verrucomicrobia bacterium]|nr:MAG: hypothetical protein DME97_05395 [Verrucomicrobiota bacterium]